MLASQNDLQELVDHHVAYGKAVAYVNVVRQAVAAEEQAASAADRTRAATASAAPDADRIRWRKGERLGAGAVGTVFQGLNVDTGELMAIKQIDSADLSARELAALEQEVSLLRSFRHPNIVRYLGAQREGDTLCVFLEYVPGGSVKRVLERFGGFEEGLVRRYTRHLLVGLEYLHRNGIAHRDIKGGNVLVALDGVIKLADFGASKRISAPPLAGASRTGTGVKGTPQWMAPEVVREQEAETGWRRADIWSVGCTVIEMATGRPPWSEFAKPRSLLGSGPLPVRPSTGHAAGRPSSRHMLLVDHPAGLAGPHGSVFDVRHARPDSELSGAGSRVGTAGTAGTHDHHGLPGAVGAQEGVSSPGHSWRPGTPERRATPLSAAAAASVLANPASGTPPASAGPPSQGRPPTAGLSGMSVLNGFMDLDATAQTPRKPLAGAGAGATQGQAPGAGTWREGPLPAAADPAEASARDAAFAAAHNRLRRAASPLDADRGLGPLVDSPYDASFGAFGGTGTAASVATAISAATRGLGATAASVRSVASQPVSPQVEPGSPPPTELLAGDEDEDEEAAAMDAASVAGRGSRSRRMSRLIAGGEDDGDSSDYGDDEDWVSDGSLPEDGRADDDDEDEDEGEDEDDQGYGSGERGGLDVGIDGAAIVQTAGGLDWLAAAADLAPPPAGSSDMVPSAAVHSRGAEQTEAVDGASIVSVTCLASLAGTGAASLYPLPWSAARGPDTAFAASPSRSSAAASRASRSPHLPGAASPAPDSAASPVGSAPSASPPAARTAAAASPQSGPPRELADALAPLRGLVVTGTDEGSVWVWDVQGPLIQAAAAAVAAAAGHTASGRPGHPVLSLPLRRISAHKVAVRCIAVFVDPDHRREVMAAAAARVAAAAAEADGAAASAEQDAAAPGFAPTPLPAVHSPGTGAALSASAASTSAASGAGTSAAAAAALPPTGVGASGPGTWARSAGLRIVTGAQDGTIRVLDPSARRAPRALLRGHSGPVLSLTVLQSGKQLLSTSADKTVRLWDLASGTQRAVYSEHLGAVGSALLAMLPCMVSASTDKSAKVWAATGSCLFSLREHLGNVTSMALPPIPAGPWLPAQPPDQPERGRRPAVALAAFSAAKDASGGATLLTGCSDGVVRMWDTGTGRLVRPLKCHRGAVTCLAWGASGQAATGGSDGMLRLWDLSSGKIVHEFPAGRSAAAAAGEADAEPGARGSHASGESGGGNGAAAPPSASPTTSGPAAPSPAADDRSRSADAGLQASASNAPVTAWVNQLVWDGDVISCSTKSGAVWILEWEPARLD
ncbi:hypothetical protein FNF27_03511 [Cafeteria roenbergensis]|uniref:Protein kinase domain-containing protein n=1 Tax=Cafeteria roenbergensis TaxID=33653 RepID=A0A5A8EBT6_CAFRO|nr:hypothetical protein FNF27_03511 [Cafeteria roenbergensis]